VQKILAVMLTCAVAAGVCYATDPGTATGKMTVGGKTTELHWAVARIAKTPFNKNQTDVIVLISNIQVTPEQFNDLKSMFDLADSGRLTGIEVTIENKKIIGSQIYSPMFKLQGNSFSAVGMHEFEPTTFKGGDVAGKLSTTHESSFNNVTFKYSTTFHAIATAPNPPAEAKLEGKPLGPGGGDPGKAYLAYTKILAGGSIAAVKKAVSAVRAKQMDDPDFKQMFPLVQAMEPKKIKVTGGAVNGDKATLTATGDSDGAPAKGTIEMVREGGAWKVDKESWKS
jgi:hypothetical protein